MNAKLWSIPARVPIKLFYAIKPDDAAATQIETLSDRLRRAHCLRARPIARARLHNTLAAVHDTGTLRDNIARAKAIGDRLWRRSFSVRFDWTGSFKGGGSAHPLVLRGEEKDLAPLSAFHSALRDEMLRGGFGVAYGFTPHITLMWADRCVDAYPIAPIAWTVRDFVLTASVQGYACHIEVARWPLQETEPTP
jgi:2'-5' RNA ligase